MADNPERGDWRFRVNQRATGPIVDGGPGAPTADRNVGSVWMRQDGGPGTSFYVKESAGTGGWTNLSGAQGGSLVGGRALVATRLGQSANTGIGNPMGTSRTRHVATKTCADVRFMYSQPFASEYAGANPFRVKAGLEVQRQVSTSSTLLSTGGAITSIPCVAIGGIVPSLTPVTITSGANTQTFVTSAATTLGATALTVTSLTPTFAFPIGSVITMPTVHPMTFGGKDYGIVELAGSILSDPAPADLVAGEVFWSRTYTSVPVQTLGGATAYIATNASSSISDTVLTSAALLGNPEPGQLITIDQGGSAELATLKSVSGTGPYTYTFTTALTKTHSNGAVFGQQMPFNVTLLSDNGEGFTSSTDLSWSTTVIPVTAAAYSGTINADCVIGDTVIQSGSSMPGTTFLLDTAGAQETVTVRTVQGIASPLRYYLAAPLAQNHTSGAALVSNISAVAGMAPTAIVADRLATGDRPKSVVVMASDSIAQGTGAMRPFTSFATLALDAALIAHVNTAKSGESTYQYMQMISSLLRRKLITLGTWALIEDSTNDIYGGRTLAQIQADIQAACLLAKSRGLKVMVTTSTPRTTSTDFWMTPGNQTVSNGGSVRVPYNTWIRAWQSNGLQGTYVDALFDVCSVIEANSSGALTLDAGLWKADASGPYTADGIHPTPLGYAIMASAFPASSIT